MVFFLMDSTWGHSFEKQPRNPLKVVGSQTLRVEAGWKNAVRAGRTWLSLKVLSTNSFPSHSNKIAAAQVRMPVLLSWFMVFGKCNSKPVIVFVKKIEMHILLSAPIGLPWHHCFGQRRHWGPSFAPFLALGRVGGAMAKCVGVVWSLVVPGQRRPGVEDFPPGELRKIWFWSWLKSDFDDVWTVVFGVAVHCPLEVSLWRFCRCNRVRQTCSKSQTDPWHWILQSEHFKHIVAFKNFPFLDGRWDTSPASTIRSSANVLRRWQIVAGIPCPRRLHIKGE